MKILKKLFVLSLIMAFLSISLIGCGKKEPETPSGTQSPSGSISDQTPDQEQPTEEQPTGEHPAGEHPSGEHPQ